ncbi:hypothetical protein [Nostoc sp.]
MIAIGSLSKLHGTNEAEFAMLVSDRQFTPCCRDAMNRVFLI